MPFYRPLRVTTVTTAYSCPNFPHRKARNIATRGAGLPAEPELTGTPLLGTWPGPGTPSYPESRRQASMTSFAAAHRLDTVPWSAGSNG